MCCPERQVEGERWSWGRRGCCRAGKPHRTAPRAASFPGRASPHRRNPRLAGPGPQPLLPLPGCWGARPRAVLCGCLTDVRSELICVVSPLSSALSFVRLSEYGRATSGALSPSKYPRHPGDCLPPSPLCLMRMGFLWAIICHVCAK